MHSLTIDYSMGITGDMKLCKIQCQSSKFLQLNGEFVMGIKFHI